MTDEEARDAIRAALIAAIGAPKRVSGDAGAVEQQSLQDLIEFDRYLRTKTVGNTATRGMRITRLLPDGTA